MTTTETCHPTIGALCHVRDPHELVEDALVLVSDQPVATITQVRLLSMDVHHASGQQPLLLARFTGLPVDLLAHTFPAYVHTADLHRVAGSATVNLSNLTPAPVDPTLGAVVGPSDPRWMWELAELARIQSHQRRVSLSVLLGETPAP